jgi:CheY-like chemotaxis protein
MRIGAASPFPPAGRVAPKTVLVVDDEEMVRELLLATLRASPYRVLSAGNGQEALAVARAQRPDLVLLDRTMPGCDGLEVCRLLKGDPETGRITIIMLTARSQPQDRAAALAVRADGYVTKPFRPGDLLRLLRARLDS